MQLVAPNNIQITIGLCILGSGECPGRNGPYVGSPNYTVVYTSFIVLHQHYVDYYVKYSAYCG